MRKKYFIMLGAALGVTVAAAAYPGGEPCDSFLTSKNHHRCLTIGVFCDDTSCTGSGPCNHCSAHEEIGVCVAEPNRRCLQLEDCDGCGLFTYATCVFNAGQWVCQVNSYGDECMRNWCSDI